MIDEPRVTTSILCINCHERKADKGSDYCAFCKTPKSPGVPFVVHGEIAEILRLTKGMRDLGVSGFNHGELKVSFWQPLSSAPKLYLASVDPGADTTKYTDSDLFSDPEDPDRNPAT